MVYTAVYIKHKGKIFSDIEETKILFHALSKNQSIIKHFIFRIKQQDMLYKKAGSLIIKNMIGCYYNVMGMPINTLKTLLLDVGIDLWDFLKHS